MTKKEQKQWLLDQIDLAIFDVPGEYSVEGNHHVFKVPETTCIYKICTKFNTDPSLIEQRVTNDFYRINRLTWFKTKINKPFVKQRNYFANNYNVRRST